MRLRPLPTRARKRPRLRTILVLPTLITMGNLLAGVLAIAYLQDAAAATELARQEALWAKAAWLIFVGMLCDALDGRIARLTRSSSPFGAQLDSLADVVTFGVVPAMLAKTLLTATFPMVGPRLLTALVLVYVVGAALRLARYNVESARVSEESRGHVTMVFRGLPSPAAAGVVACLVLLRHTGQIQWMDWVMLVVTPLLGLLMITRLPYPHVLNRFLDGDRPLAAVVPLVVLVFLTVAYFLETITAMFLAYAASGPVLLGLQRATGWPDWATREDEDEADLEAEGPGGAETSAPARVEGRRP